MPTSDFSPGQPEVLQLIPSGLSNPNIVAMLGLA